MMPVRNALVAMALLVGAPVLNAQVNPRPGRLPRRAADSMMQDVPVARRRQVLEQQIRQRLWQVAKRRVALTDDQMDKLEQVTIRYDQRRRQLGQQEKTHRQILRAAALADSVSDQSGIANALDQIQQIQRQRVDLQIEEQKELSNFMTPLQRARFMALQEEFRRRMQELLRAQAPGAAPAALQSP